MKNLLKLIILLQISLSTSLTFTRIIEENSLSLLAPSSSTSEPVVGNRLVIEKVQAAALSKEEFVEQYLKEKDPDRLVKLLQQYYGLTHIKVQTTVFSRGLVSSPIGKLEKEDEKNTKSLCGKPLAKCFNIFFFMNLFILCLKKKDLLFTGMN